MDECGCNAFLYNNIVLFGCAHHRFYTHSNFYTVTLEVPDCTSLHSEQYSQHKKNLKKFDYFPTRSPIWQFNNIIYYYYYYFFFILITSHIYAGYLQFYIWDKPWVSRVYNFAAVTCLQFTLHVMLFPMLNILYLYISTFRSICAVPNMAVCRSSLISCFPGIFFGYFLNDSEMVPVGPIVPGYYYYYYYYYYNILHCGFSYLGPSLGI